MKVIDQCWINCIRMWGWVSSHLPEGFSEASEGMKRFTIDTLKGIWLKENGFTKPLMNDCFFCDYDRKHGGDCNSCPPKLMRRDFHCTDKYSCYFADPTGFYLRVVKLNKIRIGKGD